MSLAALFMDLAVRLQSSEFLQTARQPEQPTAVSRQRKLPLPTLVALMLTGMRMSIQAELDVFFGHLQDRSQLVRTVSEQAFAQARAKLSLTAIPSLNDWLVARAEQYGFVPRWCRLRLVAADASTVRFGLRASHVKRAALPEQILFGLFLPGAELMLAASLHAIEECGERQMLVQHLDRLSSDDLLLLDRGYPSRWLVSLLKHRCISFCIRVEKAGDRGFACARAFLRSGLDEQVVTLNAPERRDADDYECPREPQQVRLVRHVAPNGKVRVLMTNLFDTGRFPAGAFGELYHKRWRIEEAFKRLKHRLNLEHVSGLSQQAVVHGCRSQNHVRQLANLGYIDRPRPGRPARGRPHRSCLRAYRAQTLDAGSAAGKKVAKRLREVLNLIGKQTYLHRENLSKPRKPKPKPHKYMAQKPC
jgi:hypothetical protein